MGKQQFRQTGAWVAIAVLVVALLCVPQAEASESNLLKPPRLVVILITEGLSKEQFVKYNDQLTEGGFKRLMREGAWLTNARHDYAGTESLAGHGVLLTGAYPAKHGLATKYWWNRKTGEQTYAGEDLQYSLLNEAFPEEPIGTSPRDLRISTVGDQLRLATDMRSHVVAISFKDQIAILSAGKYGTAYFYNITSGRFVTSTYYLKTYPNWWKRFYADHLQDSWFKKKWDILLPADRYQRSLLNYRPFYNDYRRLGIRFPHKIAGGLKKPGREYYDALTRTPFANDYFLQFVKAAVQGENLGRNPSGSTDMLIVSVTPIDYINHLFGPESMESHDMFLRLDRAMADFFSFLENWVGPDPILIAMASDHGFGNAPKYWMKQGLNAGRLNRSVLAKKLNDDLASKFGDGKYILGWLKSNLYLNSKLIDQKKLSKVEVENAAVDFFAQYPEIGFAVNRNRLEQGNLPEGSLARQVARSWDPEEGGDLVVIPKIYWYFDFDLQGSWAGHGSPYPYDTDVPIIFLGPWFKRGAHNREVDATAFAPTLAQVLGIQMPPATCEGAAAQEVFS